VQLEGSQCRARRRVRTVVPAMRVQLARRHPHQLVRCVQRAPSACLATRHARPAPPLPALAVAADRIRRLGHCVWRVSLVSAMGLRVATAVQGMHALLGHCRRPLLQRCVLLVASV
jgi:hypothetical protein